METMQAVTYPFSDRESPSVQSLSAGSAYGTQCQLGSVEIEVRVKPDLELLPDATDPDDYEKIGGKPQHLGPPSSTTDNNHWGKPSVIQALKDIAAAYDFLSTNPLKINDISLPWGGGFDVDGQWGVDLAASNHGGHRVGKVADVRSDPPNSDGVSLSGPQAWAFMGIVSYYGGDAQDHGNHWHLKF